MVSIEGTIKVITEHKNSKNDDKTAEKESSTKLQILHDGDTEDRTFNDTCLSEDGLMFLAIENEAINVYIKESLGEDFELVQKIGYSQFFYIAKLVEDKSRLLVTTSQEILVFSFNKPQKKFDETPKKIEIPDFQSSAFDLSKDGEIIVASSLVSFAPYIYKYDTHSGTYIELQKIYGVFNE